VLLVWCHLLTGYEPGLVQLFLHKMVPRPPLPVVQVHGERVSPKGHEFEPLSACTLYTCGSVAGRSRVRGSVRYITHDSCAISVVPPFNSIYVNRVVNIINNIEIDLFNYFKLITVSLKCVLHRKKCIRCLEIRYLQLLIIYILSSSFYVI